MKTQEVIEWLLQGDISIQYQTHKYLLKSNENKCASLQSRIATEGWGEKFMALRSKDGKWGNGLYSPKWISTHYTLLDLKNLEYPKGNRSINTSVQLMLNIKHATDGGINVSATLDHADVCVNGMILNFASYFLGTDEQLNRIVDYLLNVQMGDGGWNCRHVFGDKHSSLHTTLSVLEGLYEFLTNGNSYRKQDINIAIKAGEEFILMHHLYLSDKTGKVIQRSFTLLSYPCRWKYDILRALVYFSRAGRHHDKRMDEALAIIATKRKSNGKWPVQGIHKGLVHFTMESNKAPSRWNTLRALQVLSSYPHPTQN